MTFKYTEEDEYKLTGILDSLFPKIPVDAATFEGMNSKDANKISKLYILIFIYTHTYLVFMYRNV